MSIFRSAVYSFYLSDIIHLQIWAIYLFLFRVFFAIASCKFSVLIDLKESMLNYSWAEPLSTAFSNLRVFILNIFPCKHNFKSHLFDYDLCLCSESGNNIHYFHCVVLAFLPVWPCFLSVLPCEFIIPPIFE